MSPEREAFLEAFYTYMATLELPNEWLSFTCMFKLKKNGDMDFCNESVSEIGKVN